MLTRSLFARRVPLHAWRAALATALLALTVAPVGAQVLSGAKLTASDAAVEDWFGFKVAVEGDTLVVGAPIRTFNSTTQVGATYIFEKSGSSWLQRAKLTASDDFPGNRFGFSVTVHGDTIAVGANALSTGDPGSVYVYEDTSVAGDWSSFTETKLTASDGSSDDRFGTSVHLSGDTLVVGAWLDDDGFFNSGSAYVFQRIGMFWTEQAKLTASDPAILNGFGRSVSVSGDTVAVGAGFADHSGLIDAGAVYVYQDTSVAGHWSSFTETKLTTSDAATNDFLAGFSLAMDGDTIAVGATGAGSRRSLIPGSAYIFHRVGATWTEQAKVLASDGQDGDDDLGTSVAIEGDNLVVGAQFSDVGGAAYLFQRHGSNWIELTKLTPTELPSASFGASCDVSGNVIVIGAFFDDSQAGSAFVFEANLSTADSDGDGLTDAAEGALGTDPSDPDTDSDGLLDGTEVDIADGSGCPDPTIADSDGDTLSDGEEVAAGTNPCNVDTDGDLVPDNIDPNPSDPGDTANFLEEAIRLVCQSIQDLDLSLFNGANENANAGRRNSLAARCSNAANAIAEDDVESAVALLETVVQKVDGQSPPHDWMDDSPEKTAIAEDIAVLLLVLLAA